MGADQVYSLFNILAAYNCQQHVFAAVYRIYLVAGTQNLHRIHIHKSVRFSHGNRLRHTFTLCLATV